MGAVRPEVEPRPKMKLGAERWTSWMWKVVPGKEAGCGKGRAGRVGSPGEVWDLAHCCPEAPVGSCKVCVRSNSAGEGLGGTGARGSGERETPLGAAVVGEPGQAGAEGGRARACE